jgi:RHS repeat-associated protein
VNTNNGEVTLSSDAVMGSTGLGLNFSTRLNYLSQGGGLSYGFGSNWIFPALTGLKVSDTTGPADNASYQTSSDSTLEFQEGTTAGTYEASYYVRDILTWKSSNKTYILTSPSGAQRIFHENGKLIAFKNSGGVQATVTYKTGDPTQVEYVKAGSGAQSWEYKFIWSGSNVSEIIYKVGSREVQKTTYGYDSGKLITIQTYENSAAGTGTPNWGTSSVSGVRYSYHSNGMVRHIVPPASYRQMVNNGITPSAATETQLNLYAQTEYEYNSYGQVSKLRTHGRKYLYEFTYTTNSTSGSAFQVWRTKTEIKPPQEVVETYYLNSVGEVMLRRVQQMSGSSVTKTWYPIYQEFEEGSARLVLSANDSAINSGSFSETKSKLVDLEASSGLVTEYVYDTNGLRTEIRIKKGSGGTAIKLKSWTYTSKTVTGVGTVHPVASETSYPNENGSGGITVNYSYPLWHSGTLQPSKVVKTLPAVPVAENGRATTTTTENHFDLDGYRNKSVDGMGVATTYVYDKTKGGMTQMTVDPGTGGGKLNLITNYELDDQGRTVLELGPEHSVAGSSDLIRNATWTYYRERSGERWSFSGYQKVSGPTNHVVGAVKVSRSNVSITRPSGLTTYRMDDTIAAKYSGSGLPSPTATFDSLFPRSSWESWKITFTDPQGETLQSWTYFKIPTSGYGTLDTDYGKRIYQYDASGRQNETTCAGGTINKTTYNAMGWAAQEELGTSAGLVVTTLREFDDDGNVTKVSLPVNDSASSDRVTDYRYDFRNRREEEETTVQKDGSGTWTLIKKTSFTNRNQVSSVTNYHTSVSDGNRTSYREMSHDVLGRTYKTLVYKVNGSGAISTPQESKVWYDANNRQVKKFPAGSKLFTITLFDAAGRTSKIYQAYEATSSSSSSSSGSGDPTSLTSATVMEQQEYAYDAASNLIETVDRKRYEGTSGTGPLKTPTTTPKARVSYLASYPDALGRIQAQANYGTYNNATWTRSDNIPPRSATTLVVTLTYDSLSRVVLQTDPAGIRTRSIFDKAGRLTQTIENEPAGSSSPSGGSDVRTTSYEYTSDSWLKKLKSNNANTGLQTTEWVYGVSTTSGSTLNSNRLVHQKIYPDSTGSTDRVTYTYNRQQQVISTKDQLDTRHSFTYDKLGRLLTDKVTNFGSGVDQAIGKLENGYNERGLLLRKTSYNTAGTVPQNEVVWEYNDFNQMVTEYQESQGDVVKTNSIKVNYTYENGSSNTIRPTGIKYPHYNDASAPVITTAYTSQMSNDLGRPDEVKESSTVLSSFKYLGLGMPVSQKYNAAANAELTYGNAADNYSGYDRFGRIARTLWKTSGTELVNSEYGHNQVGGVVWRKDVKAHDSSVPTEDNHYWYDGLQQVKQHERGELTPDTGPAYTGIKPSTRQQQEIFTFDETGNWLTDFSQSPSLNQTRTHNKANEILTLSGSGAVQPVHSAAGNMTTMPKPGSWNTAYTCTWDAWNRLVKVMEGATLVGEYTYDALTRRITQSTPEGLRSYYYNNQWRVIEERNSSDIVKMDYVWDPVDRWNLLRRRVSVTEGTFSETRYVLRDNLDPVAIIDTGGVVKERFSYDAFGPARILTAAYGSLGTSTWTYLFHGEFLDSSGLYNYGYRYYHPDLGRWPSRDPIGEDGGLNLFAMVENRPVSTWDYLGLAVIFPTDGGGPTTGSVPLPGQTPNPGQTPGFNPVLPDDFGEEVPNSDFPREKDRQGTNPKCCRCVQTVAASGENGKSNLGRPTGEAGTGRGSGSGRAGKRTSCLAGDVRTFKYSGTCQAVEENADCDGKTCNFYVMWMCHIDKRGRPSWASLDSMYTKCQ